MLSISASNTGMVLLQISNTFVAAYPVKKIVNTTREDESAVILGTTAAHRTMAVVFCLSYAFLLALAQGYRAGRMAGQKTGVRFSDVLIFAQGFVCTAFVFAVGINSAGLGLSTDAQCYAAIRVCIVSYGTAKIALYLFLLERVHIVRAPFIDRIKDPVWVIGAVLIVGGFVTIVGNELVAPRSALSRVDGKCRIGIHPDAGIAVIALDTAINVILTNIFVWQLRPALGSIVRWGPSGTSDSSSRPWTRSFLDLFRSESNHGEGRSNSQRVLRVMLFRNVIGSSLLLCGTIANNAMFLAWPYATHSHACQLMCLTDIVLGMLVTNWLTVRSISPGSNKASKQSASSMSGMTSTTTCQPTMGFSAPEMQNQIAQIGVAKPSPAVNVAREMP